MFWGHSSDIIIEDMYIPASVEKIAKSQKHYGGLYNVHIQNVHVKDGSYAEQYFVKMQDETFVTFDHGGQYTTSSSFTGKIVTDQ